ncbi:MAG: hypothetical protein OEM82_12385 [Acidobacteriota bacterium]|nr:hypothetical protein [Acidobacteriota bacterium]MDH3530637.1 hypothetical protein [Acidobacteriota bacterium]
MSSDEPKEKQETGEVGGIPLRTSVDEFGSDEMLSCGSCSRKTPPNRLDCIYCGAALSVGDGEKQRVRPVLRPPEPGQPGYSLIYKPGGRPWNDRQLELAASMTKIDKSELRNLTSATCALPLAYSETDETAGIAAERLLESGVSVDVLDDGVFELERPQKRLRGISAVEDGRLALILFNNDEVEVVSGSDIGLILTGLVIEKRIEAKEKHKRKGRSKVLNTSEGSGDETFVDIYLRSSPIGFQIRTSGFDFSFLGRDKEMLAAKNIGKTIAKLREFAPAALFDDSYSDLRSSIDLVWEVAERHDTKSVKSQGFGSFEKLRVMSSSNIEQFTKYSRLQWMNRFGKAGAGLENAD